MQDNQNEQVATFIEITWCYCWHRCERFLHLSLFSRAWSRNHFCKYTFISVLNHFFCFRITAGNTNSLYHRKKIKIGYSPSLFISSNDSSGSIILFDDFNFILLWFIFICETGNKNKEPFSLDSFWMVDVPLIIFNKFIFIACVCLCFFEYPMTPRYCFFNSFGTSLIFI